MIRRFGMILLAIILALASALLIFVTWFAVTLVFDGINASMMRFESEPPEGWEYWRRREFNEALPGLVLLGSISIVLAILLGYCWTRLWKRSRARSPRIDRVDGC
jgi:hypothetical protein